MESWILRLICQHQTFVLISSAHPPPTSLKTLGVSTFKTHAKTARTQTIQAKVCKGILEHESYGNENQTHHPFLQWQSRTHVGFIIKKFDLEFDHQKSDHQNLVLAQKQFTSSYYKPGFLSTQLQVTLLDYHACQHLITSYLVSVRVEWLRLPRLAQVKDAKFNGKNNIVSGFCREQ